MPPAGEAERGQHYLRRDDAEESDLLAHAAVFTDGRSTAAIVSLDVAGIERSVILSIRDLASRMAGIPASNITIAANHVHLAPPTGPMWRYSRADSDPGYMEFLRHTISGAIKAAKMSMRPARIASGYARTNGLTFNRRYVRPDGGIKMVFAPDRTPGLPAEGPTDPDFGYLLFEEPDGAPITLITSFSAHNHVVGGSPVAGRPPPSIMHRDFGGRFGDVVRRKLGADVPTVYLAGACGNTSWEDPDSPPPIDGRAAAWAIGERLADAYLDDVKGRARVDIGEVRLNSVVVDIPDRPLSESQFCDDDCRGTDDDARALDDQRWPAEAEAIRLLGPTSYPVEIGGISIDDEVAISTNPAELFVEFGLQIKERSPFKTTLISELSNGWCGYVPTEEAFSRGGYETHRSVFVSRLVKNAGHTIVDRSVEMLERCCGSRK